MSVAGDNLDRTPPPKITYRDYLIWTAAHTAHALNEGIRKAIDMRDEAWAIRTLESALATARTLAEYREPNPETVEARPDGRWGPDHPSYDEMGQ